MKKFACLFFLAACGAPKTSPVTQNTKSATQFVATVSDIPAGYVITPNGYYHQSCVHGVASGAVIHADGSVSGDPDTQALAPCAYPRVSVQKDEYTPPSSWVMDSIATAATPVARMTANFVVPENPASSDGQVVFLFPGIRPADGSSVLQPVLQWGEGSAAGGGNSWAVASWACAAVDGGTCPYSTLLAVSPGDTLYGEIDGTDCDATGVCAWTIVTTDVTTNQTTQLTSEKMPEAYTLLFGGVLESYDVKSCSDYPADQKANFTNTNFYDSSGALIAPAWSPQYDVTTYCKLDIQTTAASTELDFTHAIVVSP